ncbi:hypothetical protein GBA63_18000 [Rubrobacter tropicus]|uniref:Uncharacterized protein n=1 Tax=Rubrobacter tropicus TaxID=2653851 RepID=A0A6G8QCW1_9ACTN|nr:hypothetical protein [Rubrobacter tropicus]QIN84326.1 hypothetical protein GBA63_18000 [Rubrobacter tropicus]
MDAKQKAEEIAWQGREIYEWYIRSEEFDREHDGEFLVVDVTTGNYAVGADDGEALGRMEERNTEGLFHIMRVGYRAGHRIGGAGLRYGSLQEFFECLERRRRDDNVEPLREDEAVRLANEELHAMRRERRVTT